MIKIIKEGTRGIRECETCGCLFSFDIEDIEVTHSNMEIENYEKYVKCPQCSFKVEISFKNCSNCVYKLPVYPGIYLPKDICNECGSENGFKNWEPMEGLEDEE